MKKLFLYTTVFLICGFTANSAETEMQQLDSAARSAQTSTNSIMYRQNADQYRQLSDEQKAMINQRREEARRQEEEYQRRQAEIQARQEAERRRAEALKPITLYGGGLKIYALVNGEVISSSDMESRINAFIMTTGIPYNKETKTMITDKVLQSAIDEKLKIQEAQKNKIRVTQKELNQAVRDFEMSYGIGVGELQKILAQSKVSINVWKKQMEADIAWRKLISSKGYGNITVSEGEIDREINNIKKDMQTTRYMVSELVRNKKSAKDLHQLVDVLRQDPRFELYAMQFSQSPTSANGGKLGWVTKGQLPPQLDKALLRLKEGDVSNPIAYGQDYYILKLEKIYNPQKDAAKIPSRKEVRIFLENKKLEELSIKYIKDLRNRALIEKRI